MIIAGAGIEIKDQLSNAFSYVTDITPTILALTGVEPAPARYGGRSVEPIIGRSLMPLVQGSAEAVYGDEDAVGHELMGHGALFMGDYKLVFNRDIEGDSQWRLFNIVADPGETMDLSAHNPAQLQLMLGHYQQYIAENNILPMPPGFSFQAQVIYNGLQNVFRDNILIAILLFLLILPFVLVYRSKQKPK